MANINDFIKQQVASAAGNFEIPANLKEKVLGGLGSSILGSLTQTVTKADGIDQIKNLVTGKVSADKSPITALAGNIFSKDILSKLNLGGDLKTKLAGVIPSVMGKLGSIIKDQDGDGDIDFQDLIITLKGGAGKSSGLLGMLGSFLKK